MCVVCVVEFELAILLKNTEKSLLIKGAGL